MTHRLSVLLAALLPLLAMPAHRLAAQPCPGQCDKPQPRSSAPAARLLTTRTYQVADLVSLKQALVVKPRQFAAVKRAGGQTEKASCWEVTKEPAAVAAPEWLIERICREVAPSSWQDRGGPGAIDYFPLSMSLVVSQTPEVHEQVARLLSALGEQAATEVLLEVRIFTCPAGWIEKVTRHLGKEGKPACELDQREAFLLLEGLQANPRANIVSAPRVTTLDGREASVQVGGSRCGGKSPESCEDGIVLSLLPTVSAGRRFISLTGTVSINVRTPGEKVSTRMRLRGDLPSGSTLLLGPGIIPAPECGGPVLQKCPHPERLFQCQEGVSFEKPLAGAKPDQEVGVLVTARALAHEPEAPRPIQAVGYRTPERVRPAPAAPPRPAPAPAAPPRPAPAPGDVPLRVSEKVTEALAEYFEACSRDDMDRARRAGKRALNLDPACFSRVR